jgi:hypothetical protein
MFFVIQSLRQRTEKPFVFVFVFRFTVALPEFRLRLQAEPPLCRDDHKFVSVPILLKEPSVLRLPVRRPDIKITTLLLLLT